MCADVYNCITQPMLAETCRASVTSGNLFHGACEKQPMKANWKSKRIHGIIYQKLNVGNCIIDIELTWGRFNYFILVFVGLILWEFVNNCGSYREKYTINRKQSVTLHFLLMLWSIRKLLPTWITSS